MTEFWQIQVVTYGVFVAELPGCCPFAGDNVERK